MILRLATIPPTSPFLETLARRWSDEAGEGELAHGLILLPTRRAARALADAFLRVNDGRPTLLPRITAIGALDEAPLALAGALDLPPAVEPAQRLAVLAAMILKRPAHAGGVATVDRAWMLARELAALLDEAARAEVDLPRALAALAAEAGAAFAEHWQQTIRFLEIATQAWPAWLAEQGMADQAGRQAALLAAQARAWADHPPRERVWAAGVTAGFPAVARLLRVVARLPGGCVVLPGLDTTLAAEAWDALPPSHPQAGLRALLAGLAATRADVACWDAHSGVPGGRSEALRAALLPEDALHRWREPGAGSPEGIRLLEPADQQEEAVAIALAMRDALEQPGRRVALVTPDRALAGRVAAELTRWGVVADDSAGEPLAHTPPAVFLRLLARAVAEEFAPVALLSLLKHPLAAAGLPPAACRQAARVLERHCLRGPSPPPGILPLYERSPAEAERLLDALAAAVAPLHMREPDGLDEPAALLASLVGAAEALAATDTLAGPARLWAHEEGEALAALLASAIDALPPQRRAVLPGLLDALLEGEVVRTRRALRGRDAGQEHPRVFIWGLLEARLQAVDLVVLGGLSETVWPAAADPGPWLSRRMRALAGLPDPEERVGQAAHDFCAAAAACPEVILSSPKRRDGAPAVPSRFLVRLQTWLAGQDEALSRSPEADWARLLDQPEGGARPVAPPEPRPPAARRPRSLSVTDVETLMADPYAIYAKRILKLRKRDELEQPTDAADYGTIVHAALNTWLNGIGDVWPPEAGEHLRLAMETELQRRKLRPALVAWWAPRLRRIADWVAAEEARRRAAALPVLSRGEVEGKLRLDAAGPFTLTGRADRIESRPDGTLAIIDYKTGETPTGAKVADSRAPQLPLEAAMAEAGAFGDDFKAPAAELAYWRLTGGRKPGEIKQVKEARVAGVIRAALPGLTDLVSRYANENAPYLSRPDPSRAPRHSDYAQLARVAEWSSGGEESGDDGGDEIEDQAD